MTKKQKASVPAQPKVVYDPNLQEWVEVLPGEDPNAVVSVLKENEANLAKKRTTG
jgi:hypothetical protein